MLDLDGTSAESRSAIVAFALEQFGGLDFYHSTLAGGTEGDVDALNCPVEVLERALPSTPRATSLQRKRHCQG
ncbi:MAG: hypothetical protein IPF97_06260 [Sphingomonadales bacterium]|nr:hypothetical protein [Sphingomonadales bacterium]